MKKLSKGICGILAAAMLATVSTPAMNEKSASAAGGENVVDITVDGNEVLAAAENVNGLTYKGFGVLSANSTSNLLIDYKYESPYAYEELLDVLFGGEHPLMNHVKIEMGNDGNNSTGADSCTMRYEDEEADASRSPGFILAADAKKVNPLVKVSILRWEMPEWVQSYWNNDRTNKGFEAMYKWYKETILDAYEKYGYIIDYVNPDKNETGDPDEDFIKWIKERIVNDDEFPAYMTKQAIDAYHNMKIVASDEYISLNIVPSMRNDEEVYKAVDAIGLHYTTGTATSTKDYVAMADVDDKEVWYSEGCGNFSYTEYQKNKTTEYGAGTIGGYQSPLAMCDCMVKSAVYSRRSHYIFQPAIGSFYEGSQYDHKELLSAREPWSGHIHYDDSIYLLSHFTKFAKTGWENGDNTAGIWRIIPGACGNNSDGTEHLKNEKGEPSYMTLAAPDAKNFSTILVNNSARELTYAIDVRDMDIADGSEIELWKSKTDSYLQYVGNAVYEDGKYIVEVEPYSIITATTLDCAGKEEYTKRLPKEGYNPVLDTNEKGSAQDTASGILYADDYSYSGYDSGYLQARGNEPRYTVDYSGAYAVEDGKLKHVLNSAISQWQNNTPSAVIGDYRWMNYNASVDVTVPDAGYAGIVIREQTGLMYQGSGYSLQITGAGKWTLKKGYGDIASGTVSKADTYRLSLQGNGSIITASVNGETVKEYTDSNAELFGRIRIFNSWDEVTYDNLVVSKVDGVLPYGETLIDNASDKVKYNGNWDISTNGSSSDWYRSTSKSSEEGASFTFDIDSDGFSLIGKNDSVADIEVEVDGKLHETAATNKSNNHCSAYITDGLGDGKHTVKVTLKSGTFVLDAIMPFGNIPVNVSGVNAEIIDAAGNKVAGEVLPGSILTVNAGVTPDNATCKELRYISSNKNIAVVDSYTGKITIPSNASGEVKITVMSTDGSKKNAVINLKVNAVNSVNNGNSSVVIQENKQTVVATPVNNTDKKITKPKQVKLISVKVKGKKTTIKWKKVKGASGYIIMRSAKQKKGFKTIATVKKASVTKYVDKKSGSKYYYKVCAFVKDGKKVVKGKFSNVCKSKK